ncbi:MAG: ABC transporter permease [Candidatus Micrarchaeota archaeon]
MEHGDLLKYAVTSMTHRSLRSWLTILGIVIGIGSIVVLISLAQGLDTSIKSQLSTLGTNYMFILPGNLFGGEGGLRFGPPVLKGVLYTKDADTIRRVPGVIAVSGNVAAPFAVVEFKGENVSSSIAGVNPAAFAKYVSIGYESGKFISEGDFTGVTIGNDVAHKLFKNDIKVGDTLVILGKNFRVKGVIAKAGNTGGNVDSGIYVEERALRLLLPTFDKDKVSSILAVTEEGRDITVISSAAEEKLRNNHKVRKGDEDFTVLTAESISEQIGQITGILSLFLGGVAAISLVVGGIGVANAMFTSVLERTREIGVLKAIGASDNAILEIFLLESGLIGLIGGILGSLFGLSVSLLLNTFGVPSEISWELVAGALLFSVVIGVVSGAFPARNASRLVPVDALRYE